MLPLLGLGLLAASALASGPEGAITRAAVAPFQDLLRHEAAALCGALVPAVAAELVHGASPGEGCAAAASHDFALTAPNEPRAEPGLSLQPTVQQLEVTGQHATLKLSFTFVTTVGKKSGITQSVIHSAGPIKLELEEVGGAWLVSSSSDARHRAGVPSAEASPLSPRCPCAAAPRG